MWDYAQAIATIMWVALAVFLVYSAGAMILLGAWHQFVFAALFFTICNFAIVVFAVMCS